LGKPAATRTWWGRTSLCKSGCDVCGTAYQNARNNKHLESVKTSWNAATSSDNAFRDGTRLFNFAVRRANHLVAVFNCWDSLWLAVAIYLSTTTTYSQTINRFDSDLPLQAIEELKGCRQLQALTQLLFRRDETIFVSVGARVVSPMYVRARRAV
jgi:hypothetical protein